MNLFERVYVVNLGEQHGSYIVVESGSWVSMPREMFDRVIHLLAGAGVGVKVFEFQNGVSVKLLSPAGDKQ